MEKTAGTIALCPILSSSLTQNRIVDIFTGMKKYVWKDSIFFFSSAATTDTFFFVFPFVFYQLSELIPVPDESLPPPAVSSYVSMKYWTVKN